MPVSGVQKLDQVPDQQSGHGAEAQKAENAQDNRAHIRALGQAVVFDVRRLLGRHGRRRAGRLQTRRQSAVRQGDRRRGRRTAGRLRGPVPGRQVR